MTWKASFFSFAAIAIVLIVGLNIHPISRPRANDRLAIESIDALHEAEFAFYKLHGKYATLAELGPAGARLISSDLASGSRDGFRFEIRADNETYLVSAVPLEPLKTGYRIFRSDHTRQLSYSAAIEK